MVKLNDLKDPDAFYVLFTGAWNLPDSDSWLRTKSRTRSKKSVKKIGGRMRKDVQYTVKKVAEAGLGLITGLGLGIDTEAIKTFLRYGDHNKIIAISPVSVDNYSDHYADSWEKRGIISRAQVEELHELLYKSIPQNRIFDSSRFRNVNQDSYYERDSKEVKIADIVFGFHLDDTGGTGDTLNKARAAGIPTYVKRYTADNEGWTGRFKADSYNLPASLKGWQNRLKGINHLVKERSQYKSN